MTKRLRWPLSVVMRVAIPIGGNVDCASVSAGSAFGPRLGDLVTSTEMIDGRTRVDVVAERFRNERELEALVVIDESGRALGLLDRTKLLLRLAHQYGFALYARSPVTRMLEGAPLFVSEDDRLEPVLVRVLERPEADVYDSIVVVDTEGKGLARGTVSVKQLVLHQSAALANATIERQLMRERTRELEKVSELKSNFIAHVTHELRAPVNAIIGIVELLTQSSKQNDVARMGEMLALLASSATSLRALVGNVLDLSKLEAGHVQVIVETVDLVALVRDVASVTRVLVGRKPVTVEVVAHDGPVTLRTDPVKVKQVLMNLASNAAKFTERGQIRLSVTCDQERFRIAISDTGVGIAPDKQEAVFLPFVQEEAVHTRHHEGTGLGLSIARRMAELVGGRLTLESTAGRGSTFTAEFPSLEEGTR